MKKTSGYLTLSEAVTTFDTLDGGAIIYGSGATPPWKLVTLQDHCYPVVMGIGFPSKAPASGGIAFVDGEAPEVSHIEVLRLDDAGLWLRGESVAADDELFGVARAWFVECCRLSGYHGVKRIRVTTDGGRPGGKPDPIIFEEHHGAPRVEFTRDACLVDGNDATPKAVHRALRAWFLGESWRKE